MKKGGDLLLGFKINKWTFCCKSKVKWRLLNGQYVELQIKGPGSDPGCGRCVFLLILFLVPFFTQVYKWTPETEFKLNTGDSSASC